jgi:hypothetical protein
VNPVGAVDDAFSGAFENEKGENKALQGLKNGMTTVEAFETVGLM